MQVIALSIPLLSQGIPFLHMGSELLRSKSMERDSYDSGDWYNEIDFSYASAAWNRGLPRQDKDGANWPLIESVILGAGNKANPDRAHIEYTLAQVSKLLNVRRDSPLLRLQTAADVQERLSFMNTGPDQIPGVIAFRLADGDGTALANLDPVRDDLFVVINGSDSTQTLSAPGTGFTVWTDTSPDQSAAADAGEFLVPGLSVAVFAR